MLLNKYDTFLNYVYSDVALRTKEKNVIQFHDVRSRSVFVLLRVS